MGKLKFFSAKSLEAMVKKREDEKKTEVGLRGVVSHFPWCSADVRCLCCSLQLSEFTPFEGGGKQLKPRKRAT